MSGYLFVATLAILLTAVGLVRTATNTLYQLFRLEFDHTCT